MSKVRVKVVRKFLPHQLLLRAASHYLETAKEQKLGNFYGWFGAILSSALCVEAIGNTYGETLITDWKDFEKASPFAKLRLVAMNCGINPDFSKHPWTTARELIKCRNLIAHAKPQQLALEKDYTETSYRKAIHSMPESKLEKMVTETFAIRAYDAIEKILEEFSGAIPKSKLVDLEMEGWSRLMRQKVGVFFLHIAHLFDAAFAHHQDAKTINQK